MLSSPGFTTAARLSLGRRLLAKRLASSGRTADPEIHARNDGDEPSLFPSDPEVLSIFFYFFSFTQAGPKHRQMKPSNEDIREHWTGLGLTTFVSI